MIKTGVRLIAEERLEQINKHGRDIRSDQTYNTDGQLAQAARMFLCDSGCATLAYRDMVPSGWNKDVWHKMFDKPYHERLKIAGALIAAELDRINMPIISIQDLVDRVKNDFPTEPIIYSTTVASLNGDCRHEIFKVEAKVGRLTDVEGGEVKKYTLDIEVNCSQCLMPFKFVGLPGGISPDHPTVNFDATELRAPIKPA